MFEKFVNAGNKKFEFDFPGSSPENPLQVAPFTRSFPRCKEPALRHESADLLSSETNGWLQGLSSLFLHISAGWWENEAVQNFSTGYREIGSNLIPVSPEVSVFLIVDFKVPRLFSN
jgi:hypothetical protein